MPPEEFKSKIINYVNTYDIKYDVVYVLSVKYFKLRHQVDGHFILELPYFPASGKFSFSSMSLKLERY